MADCSVYLMGGHSVEQMVDWWVEKKDLSWAERLVDYLDCLLADWKDSLKVDLLAVR